MMHELNDALSPEVLAGLGQAAAAVLLCAAVMALCHFYAVRVERETAISIAHGLVQMVCVGVVLAVVLHSGLTVGALILALIMVAAAFTAARRLRGMDGALMLCL
jgi:putative ABC transport system permease protein